MLECGTNYKGTMSETCRTCGVIDNENHRLNDCSVYNDTNLASHLQCIDFHDRKSMIETCLYVHNVQFGGLNQKEGRKKIVKPFIVFWNYQ